MESSIGEEYVHEDYHDASRHGPIWGLLNQMLHVIVFVYTLFGMIEFKVRFIRWTRMVKLVSRMIIIHSWYLTFKFGIIATGLYLFNIKMDELRIAPTDYNCSMRNAAQILESLPEDTPDYFVYYCAEMLQIIGGPFKLLGYRAYLMFGFYSFSLLIMLAIFPIELMHQDIGFNFIRFVLNDSECMEEMHAKRQQLTDTLAKWSRHISLDNQLNMGTKLLAKTLANHRLSWAGAEETRVASRYPLSLLPSERRFWSAFPSVKYLSSVNQTEETDHNVRIAGKNLKKFKPYTRSENWFKISMLMYPMFILFYFTILTVVVGGIQLYIINAIKELSGTCGQDLFSDWTWLDHLTFYETLYMIYAMSCSISFYTSYYFGTVLELYVWLSEINQQMNICRVIHQLAALKKDHSTLVPVAYNQSIQHLLFTDRNGKCPLVEVLLAELNLKLEDVDPCCNQFGGLNCIVAFLKFKFLSQSRKLKHLQILGLKLILKKQTVYRAAYININLFLAELSDTRHMTSTILKRTTYIAVTLATMAASTTSQFQLNYVNLTALFGACLFILNLYLISAATINNQVNQMLHQIHKFVATMTEGTFDHDMLEMWVKFIDSFGKDHNKLAYKMFGYKITWGSILGFNGLVSSAYFYTLY